MSELLEVAEVLMGSLKDRMGALESKLASTIVAANQGLEQKMSAQAKAFEGLATEQAKREERLNLRLSKLEGSLDRHESNQLQRRDLVALESKLFENTQAIEQTKKALSTLTAKKPEWTRLAKLGGMLLGTLGLGLMIGWLWALGWLRVTESEQEKAAADAKVTELKQALDEAQKVIEFCRSGMAQFNRASPQERELMSKLMAKMLLNEGLTPDELKQLEKLVNPPVKPPAR